MNLSINHYMKSVYATSSCHVYQSAQSSKRTERSPRAKVVFLMPWKVKTKTGVIAAAAAADSAHAPACLRIAAGAQLRVFGHSQWRIMARTTLATGHEVRLRPTRTRLWGRMVGSDLVVVASPRIGSRRAGPATSLSYTDTTVQNTAKYVQLRGLI